MQCCEFDGSQDWMGYCSRVPKLKTTFHRFLRADAKHLSIGHCSSCNPFHHYAVWRVHQSWGLLHYSAGRRMATAGFNIVGAECSWCRASSDHFISISNFHLLSWRCSHAVYGWFLKHGCAWHCDGCPCQRNAIVTAMPVSEMPVTPVNERRLAFASWLRLMRVASWSYSTHISGQKGWLVWINACMTSEWRGRHRRRCFFVQRKWVSEVTCVWNH